MGFSNAQSDVMTVAVATTGNQIARAYKLSIQTWGDYVGTFTVEGTSDGTNWSTLVSAQTTLGWLFLATPVVQVRINPTAPTSGTIHWRVVGLDVQEFGK